MLKRRLTVVVILALLVAGCAAAHSYRKGEEATRLGQLGCGRRASTRKRCRRTRRKRNTRLRSSGRRRTPRASTSAAHASSKPTISSTPRCSNISRARRTGRFEPSCRGTGDRTRENHPRPHRSHASEARDRQAARRGPAHQYAAPEPDGAAAGRELWSERQRPRHPQFHRHGDRHQRHIRSGVPGQGVHRAAWKTSRSSRRCSRSWRPTSSSTRS